MTEDDLYWTDEAWNQYQIWKVSNPKIYERVRDLIRITLDTPFSGIGKPEPLRYNLSGAWSRRINREHRLVYRVEDGKLYVVSCRYHY